jgi:hypothetical protein
MERIAGWILTQAFVLVGVKYFLYGDPALVELASRHLAAELQVARPARVQGTAEPEDHFNHWHFEMLVGPRPGGVSPYVWQVPDAALLDRLNALAVARDQDPLFWERFAGLKAVPTQSSDFDGIEDAEDWKVWWSRRDEAPGIPLLPIWSPAEAARRAFTAKGCWEGPVEPPGDYPDPFPPGGTVAT